jgi:lysozyme
LIGPRGRSIIRDSEQRRLQAYICPAGKPTIGWGHTKGVKLGDTCTPAEAESYFEEDLSDADATIDRWVRAPLTPAMRDALASWIFNFGEPKFRISTLLRVLNRCEYAAVPEQFKRWVHGKDPETGKTVVWPGLVTRRAREAALFMADGIPS